MKFSQFTCPFCQHTGIDVTELSDGKFQATCPKCQSRGPSSDSSINAAEAWVSLTAQKNLLQMIVDESHNIILVKDWEGRFVFGNKALARVYGTTPDMLIGRYDSDFNPNKEQVDFYLKSSREVMQSGQTQLVEESATDSATGNIRHYLSVKKPYKTSDGDDRILIIANDITELKSAYLKLKERENRYDYATNVAGEGIWDWDIRKNTVTHNARWCEIFGIDKTAASGRAQDRS